MIEYKLEGRSCSRNRISLAILIRVWMIFLHFENQTNINLHYLKGKKHNLNPPCIFMCNKVHFIIKILSYY